MHCEKLENLYYVSIRTSMFYIYSYLLKIKYSNKSAFLLMQMEKSFTVSSIDFQQSLEALMALIIEPVLVVVNCCG